MRQEWATAFGDRARAYWTEERTRQLNGRKNLPLPGNFLGRPEVSPRRAAIQIIERSDQSQRVVLAPG